MKKVLKALGVLVLLVVLAAGGFAAFVHFAGIPSYPVQKVDLEVEVTPERVARGRKIASMLCMECHRDPTTQKLTGQRMVDVPPQFGVAYSLNITQDPVKGIGAWTDGELAFLLRTGIARDGRYTPPWMPKFPRASDEEIASMIAFLRSDDPAVQAAPVDDHPSQSTFFMKFLTRVAFKPFAYPTQPIPPPAADPLAQGKHLALNVLHCYGCHSADFSTNDENEPEKSKGFFGGGLAMLDAAGREIRTSNITLDPATGIGKWTEEEFVRAVRGSFRPDNTPILYPMQAYVELEDAEVRAIYAYLKTVPPVVNAVPRPAREPAPAGASDGKKIYYKYSCQSCHGETGVGLCDMREGSKKHPTDESLIAFIKNPAATVPGSKMPAWHGVIQENEYLPLVEYVRSLAGSQIR
jgi:mono/diheme cytochrome c family protein